MHDPSMERVAVVWQDRHGRDLPLELDMTKQACLDQFSINSGLEILNRGFTDDYNKARLLACQAPHSGDWLNAWPITACGLRLDNEAIRVAVGLRLGVGLCDPYTCICGARVDEKGSHGPACRRSTCRIARHDAINNIICRTLLSAKIPCRKEPPGLLNDDNKRPDGITYRRGHSTETALLKVSSDILRAADHGSVTLLGMLDLSAAFDCVDHDILLRRLSCSFGIVGTALSWIQSYLTSRIQRVKYNGGVSEIGHLSCGVPQGSVLGPLFFSLYTTDVFHLVEQRQFRIHGYADDLQIYEHTLPSDMDAVSRRFAACVEDVMTWMASNRLKLNSSKTEIIWFGSASRLGTCSTKPISIAGDAIRPVNSVRNLGVIFDSTLSFKLHVSSVARTCYYQIRQIRTVRKSLTQDSCHTLIRSLVFSRLDYCNSLLAGAPKVFLDQLSCVMRASARLTLGLSRFSHVAVITREKLHWLDFPARVVFKLCVTAFRCLHGLAPGYLAGSCVPVSSVPGRSHLRSAALGALVIPSSRLVTVGERAFFITCPRAWNLLPPDLRTADLGLQAFRKKLKTFLFNSHS